MWGNYIEFLRDSGKSLIINGAEGCGKSHVCDGIINKYSALCISEVKLRGHPSTWFKEGCEVVFIRKSTKLGGVLVRVKQFACCETIQYYNEKGFQARARTPFFIVEANTLHLQLHIDNRRFAVVNIY